MKIEARIGEKKEFSLEGLGDVGRGITVSCELKSDFYPNYFFCKRCEYGKNKEIVYWYGFTCKLPENCFIIICPNCEEIIVTDFV